MEDGGRDNDDLSLSNTLLYLNTNFNHYNI